MKNIDIYLTENLNEGLFDSIKKHFKIFKNNVKKSVGLDRDEIDSTSEEEENKYKEIDSVTRCYEMTKLSEFKKYINTEEFPEAEFLFDDEDIKGGKDISFYVFTMDDNKKKVLGYYIYKQSKSRLGGKSQDLSIFDVAKSYNSKSKLKGTKVTNMEALIYNVVNCRNHAAYIPLPKENQKQWSATAKKMIFDKEAKLYIPEFSIENTDPIRITFKKEK